LVFVAAYDAAGGTVQVREAGQVVAGQHAVHGRGHQVQQVRDLGHSLGAQTAGGEREVRRVAASTLGSMTACAAGPRLHPSSSR
jgi:hypothetical protein